MRWWEWALWFTAVTTLFVGCVSYVGAHPAPYRYHPDPCPSYGIPYNGKCCAANYNGVCLWPEDQVT